MRRPGVWLMALGVVVWPVTAGGQSLVSLRSASPAPLVTSDRTLQSSLDRIAARSLLWREAFGAVQGTGRRVIVLTADQVVVAEASGRQPGNRVDPGLLAEVAPLSGPDARVEAVMVVVNLTLLENTHRARGSHPWELQDDLDRILIHEVYGHALPYLVAGDLSGRCADPRPEERPEDACAIRRENAVRAELGLGRRRDAGLDGLALTRPASR